MPEDRPARPEADDAAVLQERLIAARLSDLREMELKEAMTPRVDVRFLPMPVTPEAVAEAIRDSGHRAFPVSLTDELDTVDGVLFVNDLFRSSRASVGPAAVSLPDTNEIARKVRRPPLLLPESMGVLEALAEMRARRRTFAIVLDEYGSVAGVATIRDLLEPLVGDLADEFEDNEDEFARIDATRWLIDAQASIDDVAEHLGEAVPEGDFVTLAGYILEELQRIPEPGDTVRLGRWELRVHSMERRRITEVVAKECPPDRST